MKMIYVKWVDSTSWDRWKKLPLDDSTLSVIETVGYLIENKKDRIVVAGSVSDMGNADLILAIPKGAIVERHYILEQEKK